MGKGTDPVMAIEAALQAGLGGGAQRPDLARHALATAECAHLEAWLEAVALELRAGSALLSAEQIELVAGKMLADRGRALRAHRPIGSRAVGELVGELRNPG